MSSKRKLLIVVLIITATLLLLLYSSKKKKHVTIEEPMQPGQTLVLFCYANWCSLCKNIKPQFEDLVKKQPVKNVTFVMLEDAESGYGNLRSKIGGYPSIVVDNGQEIKTYEGTTKTLKALDIFLRHNK